MIVKFYFGSAFDEHGFLFNEEKEEFSYFVNTSKSELKLNKKTAQTLSRSLFSLVSGWEENLPAKSVIDGNSIMIELEYKGKKQKKTYKNAFPENFSQIYDIISEVTGVSLR